jgi:hypothetical protein
MTHAQSRSHQSPVRVLTHIKKLDDRINYQMQDGIVPSDSMNVTLPGINVFLLMNH